MGLALDKCCVGNDTLRDRYLDIDTRPLDERPKKQLIAQRNSPEGQRTIYNENQN